MEQRHLMFDFDGVVGDTFDLNWRLVRELHPEITEQQYRLDHHLGNVFEAPVVPFTPESTRDYYASYGELLSVEHIKAALPALRNLTGDFRFHIVSSNCESAITRVLREANFLDHFGEILGYGFHASKKEKFKFLAHTHGVALSEALFVTDTLGDLKEAATVGLPSIAVTFGYHPRELLAQGNSVAIVDTWNELVAVCRRV